MPDLDGVFGVAYGLGVDSTALLVGLRQRDLVPDFILFADVGAEKQATYDYLPIIQRWLARYGMPPVSVVRRIPPRAPYTTIEENMLMNATLPGATFGKGSCTVAWKIEPQNGWCRHDPCCQAAWTRGDKVTKLIGFNAGEDYRQSRANDKAHISDDPRYRYAYPLIRWGWNRERCMREIRRAGLPVPPKSACIFCPNQQPHELRTLTADERARVIRIELAAEPYNRKVEGLWRRTRKSDGRPGSITRYLLEQELPFTPLTVLGQMPLNTECRKFRDGYSFDPPHDRPCLRRLLEQHGHAVPDLETDVHLSLATGL